MMMSARNNSSSNSKYPFTETQWQELEHQALIFKYMISGIPIPPDLIFTVQKSLLTSHYSNPQQLEGGWGCYGRKADPEPGRCRRTDGKKWRCSKEAYPDSKYCERHMHRTKNRSRKPVESPNTNTNTTTTTSSGLSLSSPSSSSASSVVTDHHNTHPYFNTSTSAMYPYSSRNTTTTTTTNLSTQNSIPHEMMILGGNSAGSNYCDKDYRYFLPETSSSASGTLKSLPESYTPFGGYPSPQLLQSHDDSESSHDIHGGVSKHQQMHHFFTEKWPQKDGDSWLNDIHEDHHHHDPSAGTLQSSSSPFSTTQLSMSLPMSSNHNLFSPSSRLHNGG